MYRREFLAGSAALLAGAGLALVGVGQARAAGRPPVSIYRSPGCACCVAWARHLQRAGFKVALHTVEDITPFKARGKVPEALWSCHTAFVGDYVVEGHVPAKEIERLLKEKPAARGLAVAGMPVGSPGMEIGGRVDRYQVILFGPGGQRVYATYGS